MRQLVLWVPRDRGAEVSSRIGEAGATHTVRLEGESDGPAEVLLVHMPNERFDGVVEAVAGIEDLRMVFQRDSVILMEPPAEAVADQVTDSSLRGPLEILVEGLQSLGSWASFLTYSAIAGAIVWSGLASNTMFLLTAAMLIAPYAAPAMTAALATARGDASLLRSSVSRYLASVGTTAAVAAFLSVVTGMAEVTHLMEEVANVSAVSVLLPMAAGVAGAMNFAEPDRTGTVSGAGIGMLVALALAPQAGLLGMGLVVGEPRIVTSAAFVATLQLLGINAAAGAAFLLLGVRRRIPRAADGRRSVALTSLSVTAAAAVALLGLQWGAHPELTRETMETRAEAEAIAFLDAHPDVLPVETTARFPLAPDVPHDLLVLSGQAVLVGSPALSGPQLEGLLRRHLMEALPGIDVRVGLTLLGQDGVAQPPG